MSNSTEEKLEQDKQFIRVWLEAINSNKTQSWIASQLDVTRQYVSAKAVYMRSMGVNLPEYSRGRPGPGRTVIERKDLLKFRVDELNKLIEEIDNADSK